MCSNEWSRLARLSCHDYRIVALNSTLSTAVVVLSEDTAFKQRVNRGAAALDSTIKNNMLFWIRRRNLKQAWKWASPNCITSAVRPQWRTVASTKKKPPTHSSFVWINNYSFRRLCLLLLKQIQSQQHVLSYLSCSESKRLRGSGSCFLTCYADSKVSHPSCQQQFSLKSSCMLHTYWLAPTINYAVRYKRD